MASAEQIAFWRAISESPDDDTPRLVYADWLQEHGDQDRAELIRVQCEREKLERDRRKRRKERERLEVREEELLDQHGDRWLSPLRTLLEPGLIHQLLQSPGSLPFRRGFITCLPFALDDIRRITEMGEDLEPFDYVGVVNGVVTTAVSEVRAITRWCWAGCLRSFFVGGCGDAELREFVESATVRNLLGLSLWRGRVTDLGVRKLAVWPRAAILQHLDLSENAITDDGASALLESRFLAKTIRLNLDGNPISNRMRTRLRQHYRKVSVQPPNPPLRA